MSSTNNKPELANIPLDEVPNWLNEEFFINILRKEHKSDDLKVNIVSIKPAVSAGENYVASLYRVAVETQGQTHSFIVKFFQISMEDLVDFPVFPNEMRMYRKIIPGLENEYKQIGEEVRFGPKCYLVTDEPIPIIVLEDLRPSGYSMQNRFAGIDINHSKVFLSKLAKFHAASAVHFDKHEDLKYNTPVPYSREYEKFLVGYEKQSFPYFIDAIRGNEILRPFADKIAKWEGAACAELARIVTTDCNGFNVMNHGDTWVNNYLFTHDDNGVPTDALMIDYQISLWGSPSLDLHLFLVSSTENEMDDTEFDNLIKYYHTVLIKNLQKLEYKRKMPTLKELHIDLLKTGFFAAFHCFFVVAFIHLAPRKDANMETMFLDPEDGGDAVKRAMFTNESYMRRLEKVLPFLDRKGMLEI